MTKRQWQLHEMLRRQSVDVSAQVLLELGDKPVGYSALVRLPRQFTPNECLSRFYETVIVIKHPDGYRYSEYSSRFDRKGNATPRARLLPGITPLNAAGGPSLNSGV